MEAVSKVNVLLDSNVWRYLLDERRIGTLVKLSRQSGTRIVIAPAVLYEALRMKNPELRSALAGVMTLPSWRRLMPDAWSEVEEFKSEVRRLRPYWLRMPPDLRRHDLIERDWRRSNGGFWSRARLHPHQEHRALAVLDGNMMKDARSLAAGRREDASRSGFREQPLDGLSGMPAAGTPGWKGDPVELWRLDGSRYTSKALQSGGAYADWALGEIEAGITLPQAQDWNGFWFYEVEKARMRRFWLRTAFEYMQLFYKVTDGTPGDAQLGSYATEVDMIVSADRRFVRMCQQCRREAPFAVAEARLIPAGRDGVEQLLEIVLSGGQR